MEGRKRRSGPQMIHFTERECRNTLKGGLKKSLLSSNLREQFAHLCVNSTGCIDSISVCAAGLMLHGT